MNRSTRSQLGLGLILILLGAWFLATRLVPDLGRWAAQFTGGSWPVVIAGGIILLIGILVGSPGLAVPAAIVAGIGGILVYVDQYGDPGDWAFLWTLIPGFVGIGQILEGLLSGNFRRGLRHGSDALIASLFLFLIFTAIFGRWDLLSGYAPAVLMIVFGLVLLVRGLMRGRREPDSGE